MIGVEQNEMQTNKKSVYDAPEFEVIDLADKAIMDINYEQNLISDPDVDEDGWV